MYFSVVSLSPNISLSLSLSLDLTHIVCTGSISCLKPKDQNSPLVFSGSYDNTVRLWDARAKKAVCAQF